MTPTKLTGVGKRNAAKTHCTLCRVPHPYDYRPNGLGRMAPYCRARAKENMAKWWAKKKHGEPKVKVTGPLAWIYCKDGPDYGEGV